MKSKNYFRERNEMANGLLGYVVSLCDVRGVYFRASYCASFISSILLRTLSLSLGAFLVLGFLLLFGLTGMSAWANETYKAIRSIPLQDAGRIKPYDTFARETLELIYGKAQFKGKDAVEVVTTWMVIPESWEKMELIEVRHSGLRDALKLDSKRLHYSIVELMGNERLPLVIQELRSVREKGAKLNPYFQSVQRLENQIGLFRAVKMGMALKMVPRVDSDSWYSVSEMPDEGKLKFGKVISLFVQNLNPEKGAAQNVQDVVAAVDDFKKYAAQQAPEKYVEAKTVPIEVHYNQFHPFRWSWFSYLLSVILFIAFAVSHKSKWLSWGWWAYFIAVGLHTYGMLLRVYLSGRPPVTNMYETVVWVPWGATIFAAWFYLKQRKVFLPMAAAIVSLFCLVLTDIAPVILDDSIQPLEPVLRSTFWLTTHVLIITVSYAAFFLAFALGDWVLYLYLKDEKKYADEIAASVHAIYRSIQIGVVLLAAGTILGGVWAAYSWGRFWGWDPKETWAFIALMGYLALLHARLAGLVKSFGMAAGAVVSFSLVIMAWYGVNYVLGAGLHSYGFGAGGVEWVSGFVGLHLLYVVFTLSVKRSRQKLKENNATQ